jgi:inhibitor of cysteine peptidase
MNTIFLPKCIRTALLAAIPALVLAASAADSTPITAEVGQKFSVTLESNPTTGYQWRLARPLDEKHLTLLTNEFVKSKSKLSGAGGQQIWWFRALRAGKTQIDLEYARSWETGVAPVLETNYAVLIGSKTTSTPAPAHPSSTAGYSN